VSAVAASPIDRTFYTVAGVIQVDTYDRGLFPRSGVGFRPCPNGATGWRSPPAVRRSRTRGDLRAYLPVFRRMSLWAGATVVHRAARRRRTISSSWWSQRLLPLSRPRHRVRGLRTQQRRGRHVQMAELGAQWEVASDVFARVRWNAGTVLDRWTFDPAGYVDGVGVELGAKTFAGRLSLSASGNAHTTWPIVEIDLGYPF